MKVRTFHVKGGRELWDFGDGTTGETCSLNDYATISHHYDNPVFISSLWNGSLITAYRR